MSSLRHICPSQHLPFPFKDRGFTLIEMLCAILIIAILAVSASYTYFSFKKDAKVAALRGAKDALATINVEVYTKALLQNEENQSSDIKNIDINNDGIDDLAGHYGLIKFVTDANALAGMGEDFIVRKWYGVDSPSEPYFLIGYKNATLNDRNKCYFEVYYPDNASGNIQYRLVDDDC